MKKLLVCGVLFASTTAIASSSEGYTDSVVTPSAKASVSQVGGFTGPSRGVVNTAAKALEAKDDTPAVLTGYIVESLGDEEYRFKDDSGEIVVEIENDDWHGIQATPEIKLTIIGEIDSDWSSTSLDVDVVRLAD
ncbi:NirD/YgiW/YdeI family stress tolerance protein [Shewanella sp. 10N.7]|uniref:YgiW/YdeI family stress tolerance OB fold protein n=1 Tax=Shewanella sp. 10N.7 TaxID=2885093 RepID=UPI001E4EE15D|nr:NirD/YgiW/YdeI family stress tolerance protein [Shewanella sp. 10N.7]MCC4833150.1 NirD/YgiW/YdeI family stress tolerance protein [Shewanella sp. 10N.7]